MKRSDGAASITTHVYKRLEGLALELDVDRTAARPGGPIVVWIHGGALIMGHRGVRPSWVPRACASVGSALVSIEYRLAPETKLPEIVGDVVDALGWVRENERAVLPAKPASLAVVGESAGGYLALAAGFLADPPPSAIVSLWGYGDLIGPWYTEPSQHPRHHRMRISEREANRLISGPPIASDDPGRGDREAFYQFCRQRGFWPEAVTSWDPRTDADRFRAFMPIANVTDAYPPTLLVHGELDTDVPHRQAVLMATELAAHGVDHRLLTVPGAEHGLVGADEASIEAVVGAAADFLGHHLGQVAEESDDYDAAGPGRKER